MVYSAIKLISTDELVEGAWKAVTGCTTEHSRGSHGHFNAQPAADWLFGLLIDWMMDQMID